MNILYLIDTNPQNGGAPIPSCAIASEQARINNDITMILPNTDKSIPLPKNVKINMIDDFSNTFPSPLFNPIRFIKLAVRIRRIVNSVSPNIIHAQMPRGGLALGVLRRFRLIPKEIKIVYSNREQMEKYKLPLRLLSKFLILKTYDVVICLTSISAEILKQSKHTAQLEVIPNSAGIVYETYILSKRYELRERHNIPMNSFIVMFAGRMTNDKNWPLALEIIKKLAPKDIFIVAIISASTKEKFEQAENFSRNVRKLTEGKCLILINVSPEEMEQFYYLADLFIMTSNKEAFGRTAIEAMSRRCVVIGRNIGGIPEVINKEANILNRSAEEFYNRIMEYKGDSVQLEKDKDWFFKRFNENYTTGANTDKHTQIYKNLSPYDRVKR